MGLLGSGSLAPSSPGSPFWPAASSAPACAGSDFGSGGGAKSGTVARQGFLSRSVVVGANRSGGQTAAGPALAVAEQPGGPDADGRGLVTLRLTACGGLGTGS
jgi:hypothetical protein